MSTYDNNFSFLKRLQVIRIFIDQKKDEKRRPKRIRTESALYTNTVNFTLQLRVALFKPYTYPLKFVPINKVLLIYFYL